MEKVSNKIKEYLRNNETNIGNRKLREQQLQKELIKICIGIMIVIVITILTIIFQSLFGSIASALTIIIVLKDCYKAYVKYTGNEK